MINGRVIHLYIFDLYLCLRSYLPAHHKPMYLLRSLAVDIPVIHLVENAACVHGAGQPAGTTCRDGIAISGIMQKGGAKDSLPHPDKIRSLSRASRDKRSDCKRAILGD